MNTPVKIVNQAMDWLSRIAFGAASLVLIAMSLALVGISAAEFYRATTGPTPVSSEVLFGTIGYVIIAVAVFDVAKYFIEEEVIRGREMRLASEARRSLTKFIATISIAVFIEALVIVVRVSKEDVNQMFYPTLLLVTAILIVIGLGIYQRLSVEVEQQDEHTKDKDVRKDK